MRIRSILAGAAAAALLAFGPAAMAQQGSMSGQTGVTSGPAAGSDVKPNAAVQKKNRKIARHGKAAKTGTVRAQARKGAMGAGAPGVTAKPGTEAGPAPKTGAE